MKYFLGIILCLVLACKTKMRHHSLERKYINFEIIDTGHYKFLLYNLNDSSFVMKFNQGRFKKEDGLFCLFPDSIDNQNFSVEKLDVKKGDTDGVQKKLRIRIESEIADDLIKEFKIKIFNNACSIVLQGSKVDTMVEYSKWRNFKIEFSLSEKLSKGSPTPSINVITTENISIEDDVFSISIKVPISKQFFYYNYQPIVKLRESNGYWIVDKERYLKQ